MRILYFIFLILLPLTAQAWVKGKITERESGDPLPYVKVWHKESGQFTQTDLYGFYELKIPAIGKNTISVSFMGMKPESKSIAIELGQTYELSFKLSDDVLEEVVVESNRERQATMRASTSVETIKVKFLEDKNTINVKTALDSKPGLNILDGEPQIRGGSGFTLGVGSRVAILVDGIPLLSGDAGQPQWDFVPLENLETIEVIKGASSALYGANAMSGVIAIQTAFPTITPKTKISSNFGWYDSPANPAAKWWTGFQGQGGLSFLHSRIIDKNWDLVVGGNFQYDMGYIGAPNMKQFIAENADIYPGIETPIANQDRLPGDYKTDFKPEQLHSKRYRFNFNTRYRFESVKGLSIGLSGNIMRNNTNFSLAWLDDDKNIFRAYPVSIFLQDQWIFNLDPYIKYVNEKGTVHSFNARYLFTDNQVSNNQSNDSQTSFAEYQVKRRFSRLLDVEMIGGINFSYVNSNSQIYRGETNESNKFYMNSAAFLQFNKGFQFDRLIFNSITLSLGGRLEYFNLNASDEDIAPIVRTSVNFELIRGSFLRLAYGTGYRFPTIAEKYINTGVGIFGVFPNENIKAESSHNMEIGFKQGFKVGDFIFGYTDIAYFYSIYNNTIEYLFGIWKNTPLILPYAGFKFLNTGQSTVKGVDASFYVNTKLSADKAHDLVLMGGYTWILPQSQEPERLYLETGDETGNSPNYLNTSKNSKNNILKYRFLHTFKFDIDYFYRSKRNPWSNISAGISGRYFSKMENIDEDIFLLEQNTQATTIDNNDQQFYPALKISNWWNKENNGNFILDVRVGYEFSKYGKLSFIVNNVANRQYSLRPLKIESPRTFAFQYNITL